MPRLQIGEIFGKTGNFFSKEFRGFFSPSALMPQCPRNFETSNLFFYDYFLPGAFFVKSAFCTASK